MNHKRKKSRLHSGQRNKLYLIHDSTPAYWHLIYHTRPRRHRNKAGCRKLLRGADPEAAIWDLGNSRPHEYFW